MKKLFVGCRVRILWSRRYPELIGKEGRIIQQLVAGTVSSNTGAPIHWRVHPDEWPQAHCPWLPKYSFFAAHTDNLEPIQPEGAQPSLYSMEQLMEGLTNQMEVTA